MSFVLAVALVFATAPADAPVADEAGVIETLTAVLERPDHSFVTRGRGCFFDEPVCIDRAKERAGYRAFVKTVRENPDQVAFAPAWALIIAGVALAVGAVAGGYVTFRACAAVPGLCR
ncbi:MAG: hypothetical protein QM817_10390 [Archangium sp.]